MKLGLVNHFDHLTKYATAVWKHIQSPSPKKILQFKFAGKLMMNFFFDLKFAIYHHTLPSKTTVNDEYYFSVSKILLQQITKERHELIWNWTLHNVIACPHVTSSVHRYLSRCKIKIIPHPPYNIDLAPSDF